MLLRLIRFSFVAALLFSGSGGALVVAECPHAGAHSHACCHRNAKAEPPHCHEDGGAQPTEMSHGEQHSPDSHASHAGEQHSDANYFDDAHTALSIAQPIDFCSHCLSRPAPARTSAETRESAGRARDEASSLAPRTQARTTFYNFTLTRAVVPLEHAPPTGARRHVILGLFLI